LTFDTDDVKAEVHQSVRDVFARGIDREMAYYGLNEF
jgi:hypothetical protein